MTEPDLIEMLDLWFDTGLFVAVAMDGPNKPTTVIYATYDLEDVEFCIVGETKPWVIYGYDAAHHRWLAVQDSF